MTATGPRDLRGRGSSNRRRSWDRWRSTRWRPEFPGLLLAGDAAGFIDPITGDGLRFALLGARHWRRATRLDVLDGR